MSLWIYGINPVVSVLNKRPGSVKEVTFIKGKESKKLSQIKEKVMALNIATTFFSENEVLNKLGFKNKVTHQRVFALIDPPVIYQLKDLIAESIINKFFLMLDGVTDVHNIGAIIRSASALSVDALILPKDRTVSISADVYKTSSGSVEDIKVCYEVNLVRAAGQLKEAGFWIYGLEASGKRYFHETDLSGNICCVLGGEDTGIRRLLAENCDGILKIPITRNSHSLNVSVAAVVVMYEVQRQRAFSYTKI